MHRMLRALVLGASMLLGCHSNLYSTPRTVPVGKTQHIVAIDALSIPKSSYGVLPAPVYIARWGLGERVDLGFQVSTALKLDVKTNAIRTDYFDLAIDPSISVSYLDSGILTAAVPVIAGFNLGTSVTLVAQGGPAFTTNFRAQEVYPIVGGGLQVRPTYWLTIQPEVTLHFYGSEGPWPCYGIGFGFGAQPHDGSAPAHNP